MDNNILNKRTGGTWKTIEYKSILEPVNIVSNDKLIAALKWGIASRFPEEIEEVQANAAFICRAVNNYDSLLAENEKLKRLLEDLTPGGSEFVNDPQYCFDFVKKEINSIPSQILPFKKRADKLQVINDGLLSALETAEYELKKWQQSFTEDEDLPGILKTVRDAIRKAEQ